MLQGDQRRTNEDLAMHMYVHVHVVIPQRLPRPRVRPCATTRNAKPRTLHNLSLGRFQESYINAFLPTLSQLSLINTIIIIILRTSLNTPSPNIVFFPTIPYHRKHGRTNWNRKNYAGRFKLSHPVQR